MKHNQILLFASLFSIIYAVYPIAFFHGITDTCQQNTRLIENLKRDLGVHVECIEIGDGSIDSIVKPIHDQVIEACDKIKSNPHFQEKFNIFGFSQGTLIGRYIIEKCDMKGQVAKYLSFDGPQMGIASIPKFNCGIFCDWICDMSASIAYQYQDKIAPLGYYKYKYAQDTYMRTNKFLKMLNNENDIKDKEIKRRFSSLEKIKLIKSKHDTIIIPRDSCWFQFYDKSGQYTVPLERTDFYINDFIGLKKLNEEGKVIFTEMSGEHVQFTNEDYKKEFVEFFKD